MPKSRFASWNIFDSGLTERLNGHHHWENKALVDELLRRDETVRLFSYVDAPTKERFSGVPLIPLFSLFLYQGVSNDPTWATLENFIVHNRAFHADLSKLESSRLENSIAVFPTVAEGQLLGIFRWLSSFPSETGPKASICLLPPFYWSNTDRRTGLYKTVWRDCSPELRKRVALFGRSPQVADMFAKHADMPVRVFPYPVLEDLVATKPRDDKLPSGPMTVSFVGGARKDRGGELIADVVKQCSGLGVRFFIQARHGGDTNIDESALTALSGLPHVTLHEGALERSDYYRAIAGSVVLLAYLPSEYRWRDSGIYQEAKCLDAPVLVSAGTGMAEEVQTAGNGLVIADFSVAAIVDCIARAQRELPALEAAAARVGKEARESYGVARCIDALAAPFGKSHEGG